MPPAFGASVIVTGLVWRYVVPAIGLIIATILGFMLMVAYVGSGSAFWK